LRQTLRLCGLFSDGGDWYRIHHVFWHCPARWGLFGFFAERSVHFIVGGPNLLLLVIVERLDTRVAVFG
jgi:hypothetical protein